jgi:membrane protein GlpM
MASKKGDVLPGVLPLIPIFAIVALLAVGSKGDAGGFRTACLAIGKTFPAYVVFLAACYALIGTLDYRLAIIGGMGAWLAVACVIFLTPGWGLPVGHSHSSSQSGDSVPQDD